MAGSVPFPWGVEKPWADCLAVRSLGHSRKGGTAVEWTVKLEAKFGWGEVRSFEVGRLSRRMQGLTADEIGLMLDEGKALLGELQRRMV